MFPRRSVSGRTTLRFDGTLVISLPGLPFKFHGLASLTLTNGHGVIGGLASYQVLPSFQQEPLRLDEADPAAFPNNLLWVSSKANSLIVTVPEMADLGQEIDYRLERVDLRTVAPALSLPAKGGRGSRKAVRRWFKNRRIDPSSLSSSLRPEETEVRRMKDAVENAGEPPLISIVTPCWNSNPGFLAEAVSSVIAQVYPNWELILVDDGSTDATARDAIDAQAGRDERITLIRLPDNRGIAQATNHGIERSRGEYVAFLDHDDLLDPAALLYIAATFQRRPDLTIVYSDEDIIDADGAVHATHLKPDFDEFLLLAQNYLCHLVCMRRSLLQAIGGLQDGFDVSQDHELILRASREIDRRTVCHIPKVLYHWRQFPDCGSVSYLKPEVALKSRTRAARIHLEARGWTGEVESDRWGYTHIDIRPRQTPSVSVIVPTRDQAALLKTCIDSLTGSTDYPALDVLIIDNGSSQAAALSLLTDYRRQGIRVIRDDSPFNFAALCNLAVESCRSDYVLLLNNDIEVRDPTWLRRLMSFASLEDAGAVGCKLVYADGRLQHVGVSVEQGRAGHPFRGESGDFSGFAGRAHITRQVSAVTAACLLVSRAKYLEVGGMDAARLPVIYNDVDFCLKLQQQGYRNIYVGDVCLIHHESASRGMTDFSRHRLEIETMNTRWGPLTRSDPFFRSEVTW